MYMYICILGLCRGASLQEIAEREGLREGGNANSGV